MDRWRALTKNYKKASSLKKFIFNHMKKNILKYILIKGINFVANYKYTVMICYNKTIYSTFIYLFQL